MINLFTDLRVKLAILFAVIFYLIFNTGIHGDDYIEIFRLSTFSIKDFFSPSFGDLGIYIYSLPTYFSLYWTFVWFGLESIWVYDLIKIIIHIACIYFVYSFFKDYLTKDRAFVTALIFVFIPLHDAANYWFMALSYIYVPALLMFSHHLLSNNRYFSGIFFGLFGAFAFYTSVPIIFGLSAIFLFRRKFNLFFIYVTPGILYAAYYLFMKFQLSALEVKISDSLSFASYSKDVILQFLTMIEASFGPSAFLKFFYSIQEISIFSLAIVIALIIWKYFYVSLVGFSEPKKVDKFILFPLILIVVFSFLVYAITSAYLHTPFNLSNRSLIFISIPISYLVGAMISNRKFVLMFAAIIFLLPTFGISDHWKDWNKKQQETISAIDDRDLTDLKNSTILVSGNLYSKLGSFSHIEFFSMPWTVNAIFKDRSKKHFIALTPNITLEGSMLFDSKYQNSYLVMNNIYIYDSETDNLSSISYEQLENILNKERSSVTRHWVQLFQGTFFENFILRIAPGLHYLFP